MNYIKRYRILRGIGLFLLMFPLVFFKCYRDTDNCHSCIHFQNKSNKAIYVEGYNNYPDTLIKKEFYNPIYDSSFRKIEPFDSSGRTECRSGCLENLTVGDYYYKEGVIQLYVFDAKVIESVPWDTITKKHMVLKRYVLTREQLKKMNWKVIYP